jgi:hypothetical protein
MEIHLCRRQKAHKIKIKPPELTLMKKMTLKTIAIFDTALGSFISPATGRHPFVLIALALAGFALLPVAEGITARKK